MKNKYSVSFWIGLSLVTLIILMCFVSFFYLPNDPESMNTALRFSLPSKNNIFGTDQFGRDVLSRIMMATRWALLVGVCSVSIGVAVGVLIGSISAMSNNVVKTVAMRLIDALMSFPGILLAMMLVTVIGKGIIGAVIAIGIFMIPTFSRLVYSMVLENKSKLYIKAARSYGCNSLKIVVSHILPDMLPRLITQFSSSIGGAVLLESSLSFLGLGIQPPTPSWGMMLNEARQFILQYPYLAVAPGIAILVTVLGFNLLGDGLNDKLVKRSSK